MFNVKAPYVPQIRGRSARTVISKLSTPKSAPKSAEMPVPKEYDVIEEVISLLGRMESDRLSTQDALVKERERVQKLRDEIDTQAYKRMHDLPLAVQRGKGNGYFPHCDLPTFHLQVRVTHERSVEITSVQGSEKPYMLKESIKLQGCGNTKQKTFDWGFWGSH